MSNCSPSLSAAERACMAAVVESGFGTKLPLYRNTPGRDTSGHATEGYALHATLTCSVMSPSATRPGAALLQLYAEKIGSQRMLVLRVALDADVQEGDQVDYEGLRWELQGIQDASSLSFSKQCLITVITP